MRSFKRKNRPALLVSVRNVEEALAALAGGADVIDVKEPAHGSLGAADTTTIAAVVRAVDGCAAVTAAAGELVDLCRQTHRPMPAGISLFKVGLAGCRTMPDWPAKWRATVAALAPHETAFEQSVAVAYADWRTADAPKPHQVLRLAIDVGAPALLIDTWDKSGGSLFDHWDAAALQGFLESVRSHRLMIVLAGSLTGDSIAAAARLRPDVVAVRTAACESGRNGTVCRERVLSLRQAISSEELSLSVARDH